MRFLMLFLFTIAIELFAQGLPPVGQICPPGSYYDGANCFFGNVPSGTQAFLHGGHFYHTGSAQNCVSPQTYFDGANCKGKFIPNSFNAFIYNNSWYTGINPLMKKKTDECPSGSTFDLANCYFGKPPGNREAKIKYGHFGFKRNFYQNCSNINSQASGTVDPFFCKMIPVPHNFKPFIYQNGWFTEPGDNGNPIWETRYSINTGWNKARPLCLHENPSTYGWNLVWGDEFSAQSEQKKCYNTDNERLWCVYKAWWGHEICKDAPTDWSPGIKKGKWTDTQMAKYNGLRDLNKCYWNVHDSFNNWEHSNPPQERKTSISPKNIVIQNGVIRITTSTNPLANGSQAYDCGRPTEPNPSVHGETYSKNCPYVGGMITTETFYPWFEGNNINNNDASTRYVGRRFGYGRFEFRARITSLGHGAWPALWMWPSKRDPKNPVNELDALEAMGELDGVTVLDEKTTYFRAIQTVHDWGKDGDPNQPHVSDAVVIPLNIGEWYTYAIEYEPNEIRLYVNNCLRNRVVNNQQVYSLWDNSSGIFNISPEEHYIMIENVPENASWLPKWYRATSQNNIEPRADFIPTILEVDYFRFYEKAGRLRDSI